MQSFKEEVGLLNVQLEASETQNVVLAAELQKLKDELNPPGPCDDNSMGRCVITSFNVLSPNGNETLCVGDTLSIVWEAPKDMMFVSLFLQEADGGNSIAIGKFPADQKTVQWKIPTIKKQGKLYRLVVNSTYQSFLTADMSDDAFSIQKCAR